MGKKQFCFFQTAETGNRTPDSGVKGSGANHYPRAPAPFTGSPGLHTSRTREDPIAIRSENASTIGDANGQPSNNDTLRQCCFIVGPTSSTLAQH